MTIPPPGPRDNRGRPPIPDWLAERYAEWQASRPPGTPETPLTPEMFAVLFYKGFPSNAMKGEPASPEEEAEFRKVLDAHRAEQARPRPEVPQPLRIARRPRPGDDQKVTRREVRRLFRRLNKLINQNAEDTVDILAGMMDRLEALEGRAA